MAKKMNKKEKDNFKSYIQNVGKSKIYGSDPAKNVDFCLYQITKKSVRLQKEARKYFVSENENEQKTLKGDVKDYFGDILWYLANSANKFGLSFDSIWKANQSKIAKRWVDNGKYYDKEFDSSEQLPRRFWIKFEEYRPDSDKRKRIRISVRLDEKQFGKNQYLQIGDIIDDNRTDPDNYRFHDVFHIAFAACLGWSPVIRALLKRKRKSKSAYDNHEDGARAAILEEAVSAYLFEERIKCKSYKQDVPYDVLKTVSYLTKPLEVKNRTYGDWEEAIKQGYKVFGILVQYGQGIVVADLNKKTIDFQKLKS